MVGNLVLTLKPKSDKTTHKLFRHRTKAKQENRSVQTNNMKSIKRKDRAAAQKLY